MMGMPPGIPPPPMGWTPNGHMNYPPPPIPQFNGYPPQNGQIRAPHSRGPPPNWRPRKAWSNERHPHPGNTSLSSTHADALFRKYNFLLKNKRKQHLVSALDSNAGQQPLIHINQK